MTRAELLAVGAAATAAPLARATPRPPIAAIVTVQRDATALLTACGLALRSFD